MPWITWIKTEPDDTDSEDVRQLYERTRDRVTGRLPDTVRLASLTPKVAGLLYDLQRAVYHGAKGLTIREKEIVALVVSSFNGCAHWTASHLAALGRAAKDPKLAEQVKDDFTKADLGPRERRIADFAVKATRAANACSPADLDLLREVGLDDRDILGLVEIIAYYNLSTRLFESLSTIDITEPGSEGS